MKNPIDLLGTDPTGAHMRREDARDYQFDSPEIGMATAPFNWHDGYDVEADIASILGTGFQLPTKDQGPSSSCGGQAISMYGQVITSAYLKETSEKSAKAPYSQVYAPGGGSNDRELANIYIKQGIYKESLVPSYPKSPATVPSEVFMERNADITPAARIDAAKESALIAYAFPEITSIDVVAQAMAACKGIQLGLYGTNNGTWLSENPKPPAHGEGGKWAHYMYFGKAFLENGVKKIWGKQSWGPQVGISGWQKLGEEYFTSRNIWSGMTLILNPKPITIPHYVFSHTLKQGDSGADIIALQTLLAYDGCFNLAPTGYYGAVTAQAVMHFQIKYALASLAALNELGGHTVGPATLAKLNSLSAR